MTKNLKLSFEDRIRCAFPELQVAYLTCFVKNSETSEELWREIEAVSAQFRQEMTVEAIKQSEAIAATRQAYRRLGKDPNRYRPSAEALQRRIVRGLPLYRVNALVDLSNLLSVCTGFSVGAFDADKIVGDVLTLGVGEANEPYEAIGRGALNIESLPVYRDAIGGIGTPTSDEERTKISHETTSLLLIINAYGAREKLPHAVDYAEQLLRRHAAAIDLVVTYFG